MKKRLAVLVLGIAALSAFAGTCVIKNTSLTEVNGKDHFGGEIRNETGANFLAHKVVVAFLDKNNNLLETKTVDGCLRSLQANSSDFFSAKSTKDPDDVTKTLSRIDFPSLRVGDVVNGDLSLTDVDAVRDGETLTVTGTIESNENDDLENVRVCVVVYNDDNQVVVVQRDDDDYDMQDNDTQAFSVDVTVPDDDNDVDHVSVWVDATNADEDDTPTEPQVEDDIDVTEATSTPTSTGTATPTATNTPTATPTP